MRPVAQIAQSVEQGIENPRVGGSIPSLGTTFRFQVMPSTPESTQKARLVRAFCCLGFADAPRQATKIEGGPSSVWKSSQNKPAKRSPHQGQIPQKRSEAYTLDGRMPAHDTRRIYRFVATRFDFITANRAHEIVGTIFSLARIS
jgi:hypothetical protein